MSITSKLCILGLGAALAVSSLAGAQAATAFNDLAAWQAAHPTHQLLDFDGVATGPLTNQFVGEPGGPSFAPGGVASVISIYNGVGTLPDIQTTGVNAISGPNVIGPDAGLNGSIFVSFLAPISAIGFNVYDTEGGSPRIRVDGLNFASAVSMVSGLGQFIGATFDAPVSVVEIFLSEGGDGALVDDLRYVVAPSPAASVPLPAGLPMLVMGLGALGLTARRRAKRVV